MKTTVGVLAFHGDVIEHIEASRHAAKNLHIPVEVIPVRTKEELARCRALIIPGGESTTLFKLCMREGMFEQMKTIPYCFGTCAGAIMLAKTIRNKTEDQQTLERMDITIDRNAYGRQTESFEKDVMTKLGTVHAVFIRAPRIQSVGKDVRVLAKIGNDSIACEQKHGAYYDLVTCFHPELTTTTFHEYFLKKIIGLPRTRTPRA